MNLTKLTKPRARWSTFKVDLKDAIERALDEKIDDSGVSVKDFGAKGDYYLPDGSINPHPTDDSDAIQRALDSVNGKLDVFASPATPSNILLFPAGGYAISKRVVARKNSTVLRGAGVQNSVIIFKGDKIIKECVRVLAAHYVGIEHMTIDGGMPWNPTRRETYGAEACLTLDLNPRGWTKKVQLRNARRSGLVAVHMWENHHDNLWISNTGFFADNRSASTRGAAIYFCAESSWKESGDQLGAGYESMNTLFLKPQLTPVGSIVYCEAPTNNITFIDVHTENRDFDSHFQALSDTKYRIALASGFKILSGYFYGHPHSYECNSILFEVGNSEGTQLLDFQVFASELQGNRAQEVPTILSIADNCNVDVDGLVIYDKLNVLDNRAFQLYKDPYKGKVNGRIEIHTGRYRPIEDFFTESHPYGGVSRLENSTVTVYNRADHTHYSNMYQGSSRVFDTKTGVLQEAFNVRAWLSLNMKTSEIIGSGNVQFVTKNSTGIFSATFSSPMPDTKYCTTITLRKNTLDESPEVVTPTNQSVSFAVRSLGGEYKDTDLINLMVVR